MKPFPDRPARPLQPQPIEASPCATGSGNTALSPITPMPAAVGRPASVAARILAVAILAACPGAPALADDVLVATRTLRASVTIAPADVALVAGSPSPGSATRPEQAIGMEARVTLYAGRPIPLASLAPPAMVERNQTVQLFFLQGGLEIRAEGRALGRAGEGETVRVMNLASRSTVSGRVAAPGIVEVLP